MKKYQVIIPPPLKRIKGIQSKLVIKYSWKEQTLYLNKGQSVCDFEVEEGHDWIYSNKTSPECSFEVFVIYYNETIEQKRNLVPETINE